MAMVMVVGSKAAAKPKAVSKLKAAEDNGKAAVAADRFKFRAAANAVLPCKGASTPVRKSLHRSNGRTIRIPAT
jgi:hypothetical protein